MKVNDSQVLSSTKVKLIQHRCPDQHQLLLIDYHRCCKTKSFQTTSNGRHWKDFCFCRSCFL